MHLHEVARKLGESGYEITVISSWFPGLVKEEWIDGYKVMRVGDHEKYPTAAWRVLKSFTEDYDVVIEDINKIPIYAPLILLKRTKKLLAIVHHLNREIYFEEIPLWKALTAYTLESMMPYTYTRVFKTPIIAVSESTKQELVKLNVNLKMVTVIHNGVDHEKYRPRTNDILEQKTPEPTILYINRLKKYKQPHHIVMAFKLVAKEAPSAKLIVAGDGEMLPYLKRLASQIKIKDSVEFRGYISEEEKIRLMQECWVHMQSSRKEGWGLTVIEAAACGTPTIAYNAPGLLDSIIHGRTGILTPQQPKSLGRAMLTLLSDRELLRVMAENAHRYARRYDWNHTSSAFMRSIEILGAFK